MCKGESTSVVWLCVQNNRFCSCLESQKCCKFAIVLLTLADSHSFPPVKSFTISHSRTARRSTNLLPRWIILFAYSSTAASDMFFFTMLGSNKQTFSLTELHYAHWNPVYFFLFLYNVEHLSFVMLVWWRERELAHTFEFWMHAHAQTYTIHLYYMHMHEEWKMQKQPKKRKAK